MVDAQYLMSILDTINKTVKRSDDREVLNKNLGQVNLIRKMFTSRINSIAGRKRAEELEQYIYEKTQNVRFEDKDSMLCLDITKMYDEEILRYLDVYKKSHLLKIKDMLDIQTKDNNNETLRVAILEKISERQNGGKNE